MTRIVAGDTQTEVVKDVVTAFYIARMEFGTGNAYMSSGKTILFDAQTYQEGTLEVVSLKWGETGAQSAKIKLHDYDGSAISLALNNTIADTPITLWTVYGTAAGYSTPTLLMNGYLNPGQIDEDVVNLDVAAIKIEDEYFPDRYCTKSEGFNHLPRDGAIIKWGDETYKLVRE